MNYEIDEIYNDKNNITLILILGIDNNKISSIEIVGWYDGKPKDKATKTFLACINEV